jgi:hypothetical protein
LYKQLGEAFKKHWGGAGIAFAATPETAASVGVSECWMVRRPDSVASGTVHWLRFAMSKVWHAIPCCLLYCRSDLSKSLFVVACW